jgi:hypothetical protein
MTQLSKRIIFLKNSKNAVVGTFTVSEISGRIYVKAALPSGAGKYLIALEGDCLPLSLFHAKEILKDYNTQLICHQGSEISVLLFERNVGAYSISAYGSYGKNSIKPEILLEKAKKRLIGDKIIEPQKKADAENSINQSNLITKEQKEEIEIINESEGVENLAAEEYEKAYEIIKADPYMAEDTTLSDIDIIAEENYFDKYNKEFLSSDTREEKIHNEEKPVKNALKTDNGIKTYAEKQYGGYGESSYYDENNDFYPGFEEIFISNQNSMDGDTDGGGGYMKFYNSVKNKLLKLLSENEKEQALCAIIPESDFVKVYYEKDKYYCAGLVREDGKPKYICYAVPENYSENPPEELKDLSKWIPCEPDNPKGKGYFIIFQSAEDGKYIK